MKTVDIHEAGSQFPTLIETAENGVEVIIARAGKPVVRLMPVRPLRRRRPGGLEGQLVIHGDFDAPLPADLFDNFPDK